jgi:hypothetical protein
LILALVGSAGCGSQISVEDQDSRDGAATSDTLDAFVDQEADTVDGALGDCCEEGSGLEELGPSEDVVDEVSPDRDMDVDLGRSGDLGVDTEVMTPSRPLTHLPGTRACGSTYCLTASFSSGGSMTSSRYTMIRGGMRSLARLCNETHCLSGELE